MTKNIRKTLLVDSKVIDRLDKVCEAKGLYKNSVMNYIVMNKVKEINAIELDTIRQKFEGKRIPLNLYVDSEKYDEIAKPKALRVELYIAKFLDDFEE